jgi:hypothetical protein
MNVCLRLFCVCVVLCVGSGLATGWSPVEGVLPTVYRLRNWKKAAKVHTGCRAVGRHWEILFQTAPAEQVGLEGLYSGVGPRFEFWLGHQIFWVFVIFLSPSKYWDSPLIRLRPLPSTSFPFHQSSYSSMLNSADSDSKRKISDFLWISGDPKSICGSICGWNTRCLLQMCCSELWHRIVL